MQPPPPPAPRPQHCPLSPSHLVKGVPHGQVDVAPRKPGNRGIMLVQKCLDGIVLISCNVGQRRELQTLQNNALRLCKRYYLLDRIPIDHLHQECNIIGLEQQRRKQLLRLMYQHSKHERNIKKNCTFHPSDSENYL